VWITFFESVWQKSPGQGETADVSLAARDIDVASSDASGALATAPQRTSDHPALRGHANVASCSRSSVESGGISRR
jgi:hypothetical protein